MPLSIDDLKDLDFGYLSGDDLIQYCSPQILIKQYETDNGSLEAGCRMALAEIRCALINRYDVDTEYTKETTSREQELVKIATLFAIRNICGNLPGLPANLDNLIKKAEETLLRVQQRLAHFDMKVTSDAIVSDSAIIADSFNYLG